MRALPAFLTAAVLVVGLSACSQSQFPNGCEPAYKSSDASNYIKVEGRFGAPQKVDFPTPILTKKTSRTVLKQGNGAPLQDGDVAIFQYLVADGTTGKVLGTSNSLGPGSLLTVGDSATPSVSLGLKCATAGTRLAIATTQAGAGQRDTGSNDSIVFILDVTKVVHGRAEGWPQSPQAGMPSIVLAPDGAPGITIPNQKPPAGLAVNVLIGGSGEKVSKGDHLIVKYTAVLWSDGSVFDSPWGEDQATVIKLEASKAGQTGGKNIPQGLVDGLDGQRVGSQVLVVIPPSLGFGSDGIEGVPSNSTLVYVVDILGIAK